FLFEMIKRRGLPGCVFSYWSTIPVKPCKAGFVFRFRAFSSSRLKIPSKPGLYFRFCKKKSAKAILLHNFLRFLWVHFPLKYRVPICKPNPVGSIAHFSFGVKFVRMYFPYPT